MTPRRYFGGNINLSEQVKNQNKQKITSNWTYRFNGSMTAAWRVVGDHSNPGDGGTVFVSENRSNRRRHVLVLRNLEGLKLYVHPNTTGWKWSQHSVWEQHFRQLVSPLVRFAKGSLRSATSAWTSSTRWAILAHGAKERTLLIRLWDPSDCSSTTTMSTRSIDSIDVCPGNDYIFMMGIARLCSPMDRLHKK